jgi:HK97 family phage portal protein
MLFGLFGESRSLNNPSVPLSDGAAYESTFGSGAISAAGEAVNETTALGVPAVWQAVRCIAGTIAHLPFNLFRTTAKGTEKATRDPLYRIIHDRANDVHTSFMWRKWMVSRLLIEGRSISLIVHDVSDRVRGIVPLDVKSVTIKQTLTADKRLVRQYEVGGYTYEAWQILDFVLFPKSDGLGHYNPITMNKTALGLVIAAEHYASSLFAGGGIPPLQLKRPPTDAPMSVSNAARASDDMAAAIKVGRANQRNILPVPSGFELTPIGFEPAKQQMIELRQFQISEVSRIFNIAPAMLHDLSTGTYSNVEQQNLNFAQHTITPLVKLIEQEMNSKLFGDRNTKNYVEFNLDGLQRGDYLSRMEGTARAIGVGLMTPNEGRALDNRPPLDGGDDLMMQSATLPIMSLGNAPDLNNESNQVELTDDGNP